LRGGALVIDASVAIDLFAGRNVQRAALAEEVFRCTASGNISVYAPRLFLVEVAGVLVRFLAPSLVEEVVNRLEEEINIIGDGLYFERAVKIALATGSRGADAYYIGLAEAIEAPLVTSDKVQAQNAKRAGVRAYYVLDERELEELTQLLKCREQT